MQLIILFYATYKITKLSVILLRFHPLKLGVGMQSPSFVRSVIKGAQDNGLVNTSASCKREET